jgi:predicted nuclease of predicted toxin-antitoxin system
VIAFAAGENRVLLTADKDFGDLAIRRKLRVPGIVLLRIPPELRHRKWPRLAAAIAALGDRLTGHYTVVELDRIRIRALDR